MENYGKAVCLDLAVKKVKVNPRSSFEHSCQYLSIQCYTVSFKAIDLLILQKKLLKVFTIYEHDCHLGHVTQLICMNFHSHCSIRYHMNFGFK